MPTLIVIGAQWGDEGKGKVVDYLTEQARLVVRFQGGNNAGHTVIVDGRKTALKLIPSGILRPGTRCLLASGVVLNPEALLAEMQSLGEVGVEVNPERLGIAAEATLILPYHQAIDAAREARRDAEKIGTTGKGIGPAYEDMVSRTAIRVGDLLDPARVSELLRRNLAEKNAYLRHVLGADVQFDENDLLDELHRSAASLRPFITNVSKEVSDAQQADALVVFEGAQGTLLDISHGTYPFVTSSNTLSAYACVSAGCGPGQVDMVLGICKAYSTRVGGGPFPTEDHGEMGERLRSVGREFGTVTGRPRRCGWLDLPALRRAVRLNGIDSLLLTKLDVLTGIPQLRIAVSYRIDGKIIEDLPATCEQTSKIEPVYEELTGWQEDISSVRSLGELPKAARNYLERIEALLGCAIGGFSVGPDRAQTVVYDERLRSIAEGSTSPDLRN